MRYSKAFPQNMKIDDFVNKLQEIGVSRFKANSPGAVSLIRFICAIVLSL